MAVEPAVNIEGHGLVLNLLHHTIERAWICRSPATIKASCCRVSRPSMASRHASKVGATTGSAFHKWLM